MVAESVSPLSFRGNEVTEESRRLQHSLTQPGSFTHLWCSLDDVSLAHHAYLNSILTGLLLYCWSRLILRVQRQHLLTT